VLVRDRPPAPRRPSCTAPGCAWRWPAGPDRPCAEHSDGRDLAAASAALGIIDQVPGFRPVDAPDAAALLDGALDGAKGAAKDLGIDVGQLAAAAPGYEPATADGGDGT